MSTVINRNAEFLFLYDAQNCNPNGDPDQENKPRMDKPTKTNLVTDLRVKRYVRDYLIEQGKEVFVGQVDGRKVSVETRLNTIIEKLKDDKTKIAALIQDDEKLQDFVAQIQAHISSMQGKEQEEVLMATMNDKLSSTTADKEAKKKEEDYIKSIKGTANNLVLAALIKTRFIDIRYFGGAFAVSGFSRTFIGPIQINLGYSLHPVELNPSNTIVTTMNDDSSTFGKKENVFYSLLGFTGTINAAKAPEVNLQEADVEDFRKALILSLYSIKTDSKKNQYPRLYVEIEYKDKEVYGRLGDLRDYVSVKAKTLDPSGKEDFTRVRSLHDLELDFTKLGEKIASIKDRIEKVRVWQSQDDVFSAFKLPEGISVEILSI
jgi:CRISPR-associated protein Csh2